MTSLRKRKKQVSQQGMTLPQRALIDLVEEILEAHRWLQVLGYANQFALAEKVGLTSVERDRILEAATRAVEKDGRLQGWRQRLGELRAAMTAAEAGGGEVTQALGPQPGTGTGRDRGRQGEG